MIEQTYEKFSQPAILLISLTICVVSMRLGFFDLAFIVLCTGPFVVFYLGSVKKLNKTKLTRIEKVSQISAVLILLQIVYAGFSAAGFI